MIQVLTDRIWMGNRPAPNRELRQEPFGLAPCVQRAVAVRMHATTTCCRNQIHGPDLEQRNRARAQVWQGCAHLTKLRSTCWRVCADCDLISPAPRTTTALPRALADMVEQPAWHGNLGAPDSSSFRRQLQRCLALLSLGQVGFVWSNSSAHL